MHGREKGGPPFSRGGASFFTYFMGSGQDWFGFFLRNKWTAAMAKNVTTGKSIMRFATWVIQILYISILIWFTMRMATPAANITNKKL